MIGSHQVGDAGCRAAPVQYGENDGQKSNRPVRVLIVNEDPSTRHMLRDYLEQHNIRVLTASRKHEAAKHCAPGEPDVVILDLRLGQEDGIALLRKIRSRSDVPVIIVSGPRDDEVDRVLGLELGADHYVTEPFGLRELLARIRAVLRRRVMGRTTWQRAAQQGRCRFGSWLLDRRTRGLTNPSGALVALTKGEYALLIAFLEAPQRPLTREHLLQATRIHGEVYDRSIDVQILRLRRKLEIDPTAPRIIRTERGVGYMFGLSVEQLPLGWGEMPAVSIDIRLL
jgi:two-component system OmpR family response regulator